MMGKEGVAYLHTWKEEYLIIILFSVGFLKMVARIAKLFTSKMHNTGWGSKENFNQFLERGNFAKRWEHCLTLCRNAYLENLISIRLHDFACKSVLSMKR